MFLLQKTKYSPVSLTSSEPPREIDDHESPGFLSEKIRCDCPNSKSQGIKLYLITGLNIVFIISYSLWGIWYYDTYWRLNGALRRASTYSPIHDLFDLEMKPQTLNGTLFTPKDPSIARQLPNPIADAIWDEWELTRYFSVTADQIRAMGKDPSIVSKLEDEDWGLGDDAYATVLDVYHQLHCLNSLRRIAYGEYYNTTGASASHGGGYHHSQKGEMYEVHINHCVDMLMQTIQCSGNMNLITMHWVAEQAYPFPDMGVNKQCINFYKLSEWRKENTLDLEKYVQKMQKKEDHVTELPAPDDYYKYYLPDVVNPNHLNWANPGNDFNL
ncbi:uncharacterized protein BCR38DRAFT_526072 [Pseudomassariella vexata]|uniref:Tat pathway signal sequence n=1 Tax=Pseudomassariella vexata TaxID=1141098 RepID=A0A1Y2DR37_9PEZI|nr:uncharacterized protein BCR38DRAFT_526072 [Pseudomassariella vexata]ORY61763.1 hypothetical protein BCR38DRAFT_526072 [Pseudomassariella vexata]